MGLQAPAKVFLHRQNPPQNKSMVLRMGAPQYQAGWRLTSQLKTSLGTRRAYRSAQGDLGVVRTHSLAIKSDVASTEADVKNTETEINSLKTHVISLRSDTMALKLDLHGLSKNVVESKLVSRSTKDEIASDRVDVVCVGDDVNIAEADVLGVDRKVSRMAGDLATLKHDVNVVKCDVVSIKKELAGFKSEMATISAGVQAIQWSLETTSAAYIGT